MRKITKVKYSFWVALIGIFVLLPIEVSASSLLSAGYQSAAIVETSGNKYQLTYTIKDKDNLWKIAKKLRLSIDALIQTNQIDSPNLIYPGEKLVIPRNKNLPLFFEVTKLKTQKNKNIRVIYPNPFDIMAPSVPLAYYPTWDYSVLDFQFKVSVVFSASLDFSQWLATQGYSEKSRSNTFHSSSTSPQPINLNQTITLPFNGENGKNITASGFFYKSFSPNTVPPPPRYV